MLKKPHCGCRLCWPWIEAKKVSRVRDLLSPDRRFPCFTNLESLIVRLSREPVSPLKRTYSAGVIPIYVIAHAIAQARLETNESCRGKNITFVVVSIYLNLQLYHEIPRNI